jgi:hypothetical protein
MIGRRSVLPAHTGKNGRDAKARSPKLRYHLRFIFYRHPNYLRLAEPNVSIRVEGHASGNSAGSRPPGLPSSNGQIWRHAQVAAVRVTGVGCFSPDSGRLNSREINVRAATRPTGPVAQAAQNGTSLLCVPDRHVDEGTPMSTQTTKSCVTLLSCCVFAG